MELNIRKDYTQFRREGKRKTDQNKVRSFTFFQPLIMHIKLYYFVYFSMNFL